MTLFRQPDQLIELSLHALSKYVCKLIDGCIDGVWNISDLCRYLQQLLKDNVPQSLVSKVTQTLLRSLDSYPAYTDKLSELLDVLILPTVTRLNFCLDTIHKPPQKVFHYHWNGHIIPEVLQRVHRLSNLKVLRIFHTFYGEFSYPGSLLEFTYHNNCDNQILNKVTQCCEGLKKLDLYNSTLIGDSSVELILKFHFLEHIDLFGTYINEKGMTKLLQKLSANKNERNASQLKSFGCSNLTKNQFDILIRNYPELSSLKFAKNSGCCDFNFLGNLKRLKSFSISDVSAKDLDKILNTIGGQLILLHFGCDEQFDLCNLALKCTNVECLHINSVSRKIVSKFPEMKSVKCLYANLHYCPQAVVCLISKCHNVEVLEVNSDSDGVLISQAILTNPMRALRELNWWCSEDVRSVTLRVVQHCPNLQILRGYYVWKKYGNVSSEIPPDRSFDFQRLL